MQEDGRPRRNFLATCRWDIRYTFRKLGRDPGFAVVSILILALAIGANIAVFSVVNTLLLRPLPFPNSNELVWISPPPSACGWSCATIRRMRTKNSATKVAYIRTLQDMKRSRSLKISGSRARQPESATGILVIGNFFQVLGVRPHGASLYSRRIARAKTVATLAKPLAGVNSTSILGSWARRLN